MLEQSISDEESKYYYNSNESVDNKKETTRDANDDSNISEALTTNELELISISGETNQSRLFNGVDLIQETNLEDKIIVSREELVFNI